MEDEASRLVRVVEGCDRALDRLSDTDEYEVRDIRAAIETTRNDAVQRLSELDGERPA
jgi:hypothetical protein